MNKENELLESLNLDNQLSLEHIPDLDLYMDQVIQLFENNFATSKRNEDEKILTKTMINNYAKGKLFFPIENKKYSKEHLLLISLIYQMKSVLSINDIKRTLDQLNKKITEENFNLQSFYRSYLELMDNNSTMFRQTISKHFKKVDEEVKKLADEDESYLEQVLMVATLTGMSNFYRRAAEKIVDNMERKVGDHDEA